MMRDDRVFSSFFFVVLITLIFGLTSSRVLSSDYKIPDGNEQCRPASPPTQIPGHIGDANLRSRYTSDVDNRSSKDDPLPWCIEHRFFNELQKTGDPKDSVGDRALSVKWYDNETSLYFFESNDVPPQEESFGITNVASYLQHSTTNRVSRLLKGNTQISTQQNTQAFVSASQIQANTPIGSSARFFIKREGRFIPVNVRINSSASKERDAWVYSLEMHTDAGPVRFDWDLPLTNKDILTIFKEYNYTLVPKREIKTKFFSKSDPIAQFGQISFFVPGVDKPVMRFKAGVLVPE